MKEAGKSDCQSGQGGKRRRKERRELTDFTEVFKLQIVREQLQTGAKASSLSRKYGVGLSSIYIWMGNFGVEQVKMAKAKSMDKEQSEILRENAELKRQVSLLKLEVYEAKVDALLHKTL